jgi:NADH:ubiquinone oxidoreductase subunit 5 (subunit L)/multisubunit Na+/H+ antiporter MnhA subunit
MTKVAVYGFLRLVIDLLGEPDWWWAVLVLIFAGGTAVIGVLHALMQHDLKRLLAYHTVENIGIIFIGIGLTLAFEANGMPAAAALALTAALLHVMNHCLFKSLLFFGAGAVLTATGERDMERLGGLIHRMPQTALAFLIGSAAISALPPLNGFVSEWLTFQAIFLSPDLPQWGLRLLIPTVGAMLALSAALAAACFVKAFGITFLGRPRNSVALAARETDLFSRSAMFLFAGLCIAIGLFPGLAIDAIAPVPGQLLNAAMPEQRLLPWASIVPISMARSAYNGFLLFLFIAGAALITALLVHRLGSHKTRRSPAWDCGTPMPVPATQYTAESFAQPLRRIFGSVVFRARERVTMPPPGDPAPATFEVEIHDPSWEGLFAPLARGVLFAADKLNVLQFLTIRRYLTFVFLALIALLLLLTVSS